MVLQPCSEDTDSLSYIHTLRFMEASENHESPSKKLLEEMKVMALHQCALSLICSWDGELKLQKSLESFNLVHCWGGLQYGLLLLDFSEFVMRFPFLTSLKLPELHKREFPWT
ncbi:Hypothetical predicted protein [Olea europaea subsp. europaea]|uniref:Uncharacterized protein n=1 Tax=Olea europaea subsp. europaea TaxID=158383 RepID=A0A8S0QWQ2_OLEEU|nr:Hypothetical predicted protein [Olea europaea subsp. europaea]